nr:anti-sigma factor [Micrococcus sp. JXJ CY 30]
MRTWTARGGDGAGLGSDAAPAEPAVRAAGRDDVVVPLAERRAARSAAREGRTRWWPVAAAAAAGLLVGGLGVGLALSGRDGAADGAPVAQPTPAEEVLGDARLDPVVQDGTLARAEMRREQDGELRLEVRVPAVPDAEDGYLEVWLRDEAASRMISLGTVSTQDAVLTVPEGVRLAEYPVVDVSHEHFDGDPTHSGTSLWVGEMVRRS